MRNRLTLIVLFLLPVMGYAQREVAYLDSAMHYAELEDWKSAEKWLKSGAKAGSKECMNKLGDYYNNLEDYKQAAKWYAKADDPEGWFEHGWLWMQGKLGKQSDANMQKGLAMVRRSEQAGYRDALYLMARLFNSGVVVEQNYDSAVYMLSRLVEREDGAALYSMACYYEEGKGVSTDSLKAMDYFRRAGAAGVSNGYTLLGDYYRYGAGGVKADSLQAFQTYMLAAGVDDDNAHGLYRVAECYLKGIGTRIDTAKAIYYLRDAVDAGSPAAAAELADMYNYGRGGIVANADTAWMLYRMASQGDDPRGDYMMGASLYEQGAYDNAMGFILSAANNGSIDAAVLYAQALLGGNGVERDAERAVAMLQSLAPHDPSGQAHFILGIATLYGFGLEADSAQGIALIRQAAEIGNTRAMIGLGRLYAVGEGVQRDTVEAVRWYERAVAAGSTQAMIQLAGSYLTGLVAPKNPQRAVELYQMAADRGNLDALCRLGLCYEQGEGVTSNSRRAYNLYQQAAEKGSAWGMRLVAYCYGQGIYVDQDSKQAAEWFRRSAEKGDVQSCYMLGRLYVFGEGVKKNKKEARKWLGMAAEAGHEEAAELLKTL